MKNLLASVTSRVEAFNSIKSLFEKYERLTRICLTYYIEEDDSQLMIRICRLQISDQTWEEMDDDHDYDEWEQLGNNNGFNEYDFSEITNSEILSNDDLVSLQEDLQLLLMDTCETDCEDIIITREEILRTKVGFLIS